MTVRVVATNHACDQARLRHPQDFPYGAKRFTVRRSIEREVSAAICAGRIGPNLDGYTVDGRTEGEGRMLLAWTAGLSRVYVVKRATKRNGRLWKIITVLPPAGTEAAAA